MNTFTPIHEEKLSNGLHAVISPNPESKVICLSVGYKVGSKDERPDKTGFAHLFEHLMFDGSINVARGEYDKYVSGAGGQCNAYTAYDQTVYHEEMPDSSIETALWLESDRMMQFGVQEIGLETQKKVVLEEMSQTTDNQPYGRWRWTQAEAAFAPDCSYSREVIGLRNHVAAASMDDVKEFFASYYRPDNACVVLAGNVEPEHGFSLIHQYFGDIPSGTIPIARNVFTKEQLRKNTHATLQDNVPLHAVFLSFHYGGVNSQDEITAEILSGILGGGRSSRLYNALARHKHTASDVWAFPDLREKSSLLTLHAKALTSNIDVDFLTEALYKEIDVLLDGGVTEQEMMKAKNSAATSFARSNASMAGLADSLAYYTMFCDSPHSYNTMLDRYLSVSEAEIMTFAERCLRKDNSVRTDVIPL